MIRIALLLATLAPLTACIGPSRSPGRLGGALVAMTGAALAYDGYNTDCGEPGCGLGNGLQASFGTNLLIAGVVTLIINEVRYVPPAAEQPPVRCTIANVDAIHADPACNKRQDLGVGVMRPPLNAVAREAVPHG